MTKIAALLCFLSVLATGTLVAGPAPTAPAGNGLVFELHAALPAPVPVIVQDSTEADVPRTRRFLLSSALRQEARTSG